MMFLDRQTDSWTNASHGYSTSLSSLDTHYRLYLPLESIECQVKVLTAALKQLNGSAHTSSYQDAECTTCQNTANQDN